MARILITGASGFVGWNAVRYFAGRGHDVVAGFHTLPHYLHKVAGCHPVALELADGAATEEVVARFQPDFILHAAALARPQHDSDPDQLHRINVMGTGHLAGAAAHHSIPFVYISTDLVYPADAGVCNEDSPVSPSGAAPYSSTKLLGEEQVRSLAGKWIIIRPTLMYGDGTPRSNSFTQFIDHKWERGEPAPLFSDQFRSFLYVGDLCSAVDHLAVERDLWNELFVCGGEDRLSRAEFGFRYADTVGVDRLMCKSIRSSELDGYVGGPSDITLDSSKLRSTGWSPRSLNEGLAEMIRERQLPIKELFVY